MGRVGWQRQLSQQGVRPSILPSLPNPFLFLSVSCKDRSREMTNKPATSLFFAPSHRTFWKHLCIFYSLTRPEWIGGVGEVIPSCIVDSELSRSVSSSSTPETCL